MSEQELDRSEPATQHKLELARERGQVNKSAELVSVAVLTVAMAFTTWRGLDAWREIFQYCAHIMSVEWSTSETPTLLWSATRQAFAALVRIGAPLFGVLVLVAIIANIAQFGFVVSTEPLEPDWSRLSPVAGFKRLLSWQSVFSAVRTVLKLGMLSWVAYLALRALVPGFRQLAALTAGGSLRALVQGLAGLGLKLALALWGIAVLDAVYTRRRFAQQMRMSRREVRDEIKQREGDPRIRARLRELRRELVKRSMAVRNTRNADVLITNPTHVAVALRYVQGEMSAPLLVAKGAGLVAAAMRQIAARHRIPVVQNPSLARKIFRELQIDQSIPARHYAQIAPIFVWVFTMREAAFGRSVS